MPSSSNMASNNPTVKVVMVGAPKTGKSCLMKTYDELDFNPFYEPTAAGDFSAKDVTIDSVVVSAQIWDTGGSGMLGKSFFRGTNGLLIVVDATSKQSLVVLNNLYESTKTLVGFANDSFPCVVVVNKLDLVKVTGNDGQDLSAIVPREVSLEDIQQWADAKRVDCDYPISFFEVSAKEGVNVTLMFESILRMALSRPGNLSPEGLSTSSSGGSKANQQQQEQQQQLNIDNSDGVEESTEMETIENESNGEGGQDSYEEEENEGEYPEEEDDEEQAIAKVVIAGSAAVGKTFILTRFVGDDRDHDETRYEPTIGADLRIVDMPVKDRTVTLQIWDTSGSPKMLSIGRSIYRDADCLIMVYDITSRESFSALETYWDNYLAYAQPFEPDDFPVLLVGNKCDLSDKRAVPLEEVMEWCALKRPRKPITYIECSALCSMGVSDIFVFVADAIYDYALAADDGSDTDDKEDSIDEYSSDCSDSFNSQDGDPLSSHASFTGSANNRSRVNRLKKLDNLASSTLTSAQHDPTPKRILDAIMV